MGVLRAGGGAESGFCLRLRTGHRFGLALCLSGAAGSPAFAAGFRIEGQDARAIGSALAGSPARYGDAGFAVYNPATLAGIAHFDFAATSSAVIIDSAYEDASNTLFNGAPTPGDTAGEGAIADAFVPALAVAARVSDRIVIGVSVNATFGLKSDYDASSALRYHAQESELKTIAATTIAAVSLTPTLSVGAGLRIQYAELSVSGAIDAAGIALASGLGAFEPGSADAFFDYSGEDAAFGFTAGAHWRPSPSLSLGASYTSRIAHDFSGAATFDLASSSAAAALAGVGVLQSGPAGAGLNTPALVEVGAVWSVSERINVLASAALARWSSFERISITFDNPLQPDETLTQDWRDALAVSVGGEYALDRKTTVRAGVMFDGSPVRDALASLRIPDADRWWIAAGVSRDLSERWSADAGVAAVFFSERRYDISGALPETLFRGALDASADAKAFVLSARLRRSF